MATVVQDTQPLTLPIVHSARRTRTGVAVVIVHWNTDEHLYRCLTALSAQTVRPDRIVVVDNGSRSAAVLDPKHVDVELIRLDDNVGFAAANNLAVRSLDECEWIATLNPDTIPEPNWLEEMLAAADEYPEYSSLACRLVQADRPQMLDGAGDTYHVSGLAWRTGRGRPAIEAAGGPREVFSACAAAALYRRREFLRLGGFDESYFCYFDDVDLGFRLRLAGRRCLYVPGAVVRHVGSATTGRHSPFTLYHGHRNLVWTYWKNMPLPLLLLYLPQHLLANLATLMWFTIQGRGRAVWRAKWDALRGLPRVLLQRRRLQHTVSWRQLRRAMAGGLVRPYRKRW